MLRAITASIALTFPASGGASAGERLSVAALEAHGAEIAMAEFEGREAVRLRHVGKLGLARVEDVLLQDGELEVELAGTVDPEASALTRTFARAFIGLAFRVREDVSAFEKIYLRPVNGRAEDQLQRNHSTQYESLPEHPWKRLREESPGSYESYVDLQPGVWTRMRIVVAGGTARLFVGDTRQPCLVVSDLRLGQSGGGIALWVGPGTVGYFRNLRVTPRAGSGS